MTTMEKTKDLKPYRFNEKFFELLKGTDYDALKEDIKKNGVKVELHILPDKTVVCGHQRLRIAKELGIEHLRCKTVYGLDAEDEIKEYIIIDNLFRRQLTPEKRAFLLDELSKMYEKGRGFKGERKDDGTFKPKEPIMGSSGEKEDVNTKTAKVANVSKNTVKRARAYVRAVKNKPKKYKKRDGTLQNISTVLRMERDEAKRQNARPLPEGKFNVILADPPWKYNARADAEVTKFGGGAEGHYPLLSLEAIKQYKDKEGKSIKDLSGDSAILFLWTTPPRLKESLEVMNAWGFTYKTIGFVWVKLNPKDKKPFFGVGYFTKSNAEICLLGTKGEVMKPFTDTVSSIIISPRREHSRKPDEAKKRIKQMYPKASAMELFGRRHPGEKSGETDGYWRMWGYES